MTRTRSLAAAALLLVALVLGGDGLSKHPFSDFSARALAAGEPALSVPTNTWINVTPTYNGAPNGGSLSPMTYNVIGVYDPGSQRTIAFDRWSDSVHGGSIYANTLMAFDPAANAVTVLKMNNWYVQQLSTGGYQTQPLPANSTEPTPVDRHPLGGLALSPITNSVYLVNGANQSAPNGHPADTWRFSLSSRTWTKIGDVTTGPHPWSDVGNFSGMVYDAATQKLAYFNSNFPNGMTTWLLDTNTNQWSALPVDSSAANVYIASAGITYDTARKRVVAYGGGINIASEPSAKLVAYSVSDNKWTTLASAPVAAQSPEFAYDSTHDIFLAVVGTATLVYNPRTNAWTQVGATLNRGTNLQRQNLSYNAAQDVFVFQGGTWDSPVWSLFRYSDSGGGGTTPVPPSTPTNLSAAAASPTQVNLSWTAASGSVAGYRIYRNGGIAGTSSSASYSDTGLSPSTTYTYAVSAFDSTGLSSSQSAPATATTPAATTIPPPTSPPVTSPPPATSGSALGRGCTSAWFIDEDCDGYGVAVRSSKVYGGPGLGDMPDADDADAAINTTQTVLAAYDSNKNGVLDASEVKSFLSARKKITANDVYFISPGGNNSTGAKNDRTRPFSNYYPGVNTQLRAGDVVVYTAGTYDEPYITSVASGASGSPIVLMSEPGARVVFTTKSEAVDLVAGHDIVVDGFMIDNPNNTGLGTGIGFGRSTRTVVRNIEVQRFNYLSSIDDMHDVLVERWVSHHQSEHGLYMGARDNPGTNVTVRNSLFYKNGVETGYGGIQYNGRVSNLRIEGNIIHSNGQWGLSLKEGVSDSVFQNNAIFNNQGHGIIFDIYPGDCASGICPYDQVRNLITNNTIWVGKYDLTGVVPVGNIPANAAAILVARNVGTPGDGHDQGHNTIQNNILYTYNGPAVRYTSAEWLGTTTIQNNIIYRVAGPDDVAVYGETQHYSYTSFDSTYPLVQNNKFADPMLASVNIDFWSQPNSFSLNLLSGSPAIKLGLATGAPTTDLRGAPRTMPPDAGAYGYVAGQTTAPSPPTNVRIIK